MPVNWECMPLSNEEIFFKNVLSSRLRCSISIALRLIFPISSLIDFNHVVYFRFRLSQLFGGLKYEFGVNTRLAATNKKSLIMGAKVFPYNSYNRQTLPEQIEPIIGNVIQHSRMRLCWLKGQIGDASRSISCALGFNICWLMRAIVCLGYKPFFRLFFVLFHQLFVQKSPHR